MRYIASYGAAFPADYADRLRGWMWHLRWSHISHLDVRANLPFYLHSLNYMQIFSTFSMMVSKFHHALKWLYFSISFLDAASSDSSHKCYFIDGSFDPAGGPCYSNVDASMCCYSGEDCHWSSGLCLTGPNGPTGPDDGGSSIWRRSCTDFTWQDPACLGIAYRKS